MSITETPSRSTALPISKRGETMKRLIVRWACVILCMFVFVLTDSALGESESSGLIPSGVVVKDAYRPGVGASVGEISQANGKVAVIHINDSDGYWARQGNKLFKGDMIVTLADAYAAFKLEDGSFMTLAPETKLEITKSVYAPEKQSRSAFINMVIGKTRFVVKKLVDARHSEFKVKTATSVAGVRGSDFVITSAETETEITALQHTELEVMGLAAPDAKPIILRDYEKTTVRRGAAPLEARKVSAEEVDRLMKELRFNPEDTGPDAMMKQEQERTDHESLTVDENAGMIVRYEDLARPEFRVQPEMLRHMDLTAGIEMQRLIEEEKIVEATKTMINQQQTETNVKSSLPDFPGTP
jgi:hypothetical protein